MFEIIRCSKKANIICAISAIFLFSVIAGCKAPAKIFTIGIPCKVSINSPDIKAFKDGMADLGYVEGKNIRYIYNEIPDLNDQIIDVKIKELLAQNIDLLLTVEMKVSQRAKELTKGTDMPVLFSSVPFPVENGLVEELSHPGGNLTGVMAGKTTLKALEWLVMITPDVKKVFLPYNPDDMVSVIELNRLGDISSQLEIDLLPQEIHSVEEAVEAIENLPEDIDAIFRIPSPTLNQRNSELSQAAIKRGLPMGASLPLDEAVMVSLTSDYPDIGNRLARLAHQIFQGVRPADMPVETPEVLLTINLKTAEKIGLTITDNILLQAKTIIR